MLWFWYLFIKYSEDFCINIWAQVTVNMQSNKWKLDIASLMAMFFLSPLDIRIAFDTFSHLIVLPSLFVPLRIFFLQISSYLSYNKPLKQKSPILLPILYTQVKQKHSRLKEKNLNI